ncbi:GrpB family protein [Macrococcus epidermidis]|uniref:GrpB family protein n=1 Tax=Macrococcus epidermidis TaxID=1902580 RepID=UPI0020B81CEE|nr:GrpB family protein [Macrococcus epidermidis]UTH15621.1 GrpB family protein [Macrococcus epidermidis]
MRKLKVVPYNSEWLNMFQNEKIALAQILNDELISIHHIGSTSIPGLIAKPIIDILIVVKDINKIDDYNAALELISYAAKGENGIPNRRYFQKGGDNRTHHLHIYEVNDFNIIRHIAFRDYLIAHPEQANRYADKKLALVKKNATDIEAYIEGKNDLVKELEEHAIEWYEK